LISPPWPGNGLDPIIRSVSHPIVVIGRTISAHQTGSLEIAETCVLQRVLPWIVIIQLCPSGSATSSSAKDFHNTTTICAGGVVGKHTLVNRVGVFWWGEDVFNACERNLLSRFPFSELVIIAWFVGEAPNAPPFFPLFHYPGVPRGIVNNHACKGVPLPILVNDYQAPWFPFPHFIVFS